MRLLQIVTKVLPENNSFLAILDDYYRKITKKFLQKKIINGNIYWKFGKNLYPDYLFKGDAARFIKDIALKYCKGKGLDIGAGKWPLKGAIPIDKGSFQNAYNLSNFPNGSLDYIFSSHCLEHLKFWKMALNYWIEKIKRGGILFLYLPHKSQKLWHPFSPWVGFAHKWIPEIKTLLKFFNKRGMKVIEYNLKKDKFWSFYIVASK